jgi:hypothetical protein
LDKVRIAATWARGRLPEIIAAAFTLATLAAMPAFPYLDNEGFQGFVMSRALLTEPIATLFMQKARCISAVISLPGTLFGWTGYLVWHKFLAGLAILLLGKALSAAGRTGWLGSLLVATSPAFVIGAMGGQSNLTGAVLISMALYLLMTRRTPLMTGFVLGIMPWSRSETLVFVTAIAIFHLLRMPGRRRFLAGLLAFPVAYWGLGALYHSDPSWIMHFTPTLATIPDFIGGRDYLVLTMPYVVEITVMATLVLPLWPFLSLSRWKLLTSPERVLWLALLGTLIPMLALPFAWLFNFSHQTRYWLVMLPMAGFLMSGPILPTLERRQLVIPGLLAASGAILAWFASEAIESLAILLVTSAPLVFGIAGYLRVRALRWVAASLMALGLVAHLRIEYPESMTSLRNTLPQRDVGQVVDWMRTSGEGRGARRILTNVLGLATYPGADEMDICSKARFVPNHDLPNEIFQLSNRENGQYQAVLRALEPWWCGRILWHCDLEEESDFAGDLFVFKADRDFYAAIPKAFVDCTSDPVATFGWYEVRKGRQRSREGPCATARIPLIDPVTRGPCVLPEGRNPR